MRLSRLIGKTLKESPRDAELISHKLLVRAAYVRRYSAGVYGLLPLGVRCVQKIEAMVRSEMNQIGGQEVRMPCMMTKELWDESGRYTEIDQTMFRLDDRSGQKLLLGMTHEEAAVYIGRSEVTSYKQLPGMIYQIQTKFRDEPRARGGLIRLREFTMKDGYSYHVSEEDLGSLYQEVLAAYLRIFKRAGLKNFAVVASDNGMFGGRFSHEFMLLTPSGEDTLLTCQACDYKANQEVAKTTFEHSQLDSPAVSKVATPGASTIAELCQQLEVEADKTCKAVFYQDSEGKLVAAFVRGDRELVEEKLRTAIESQITLAGDKLIEQSGGVPGSAGPLGLDLKKVTIVMDLSAEHLADVVVGANDEGYHYIHFDMQRDFLRELSPSERLHVVVADIAQANEGDPCPECGDKLVESRGIEIGNIFHLGDRYSKSMGWSYLDENGKARYPYMGCYGLGVSRLLPSILEESHDKWGMILPITVAPFDLHLVPLNYHKEAKVREQAEELYQKLSQSGIDVLLDDRNIKAGPQFADADLIGIPLRLTISKKTLAAGKVELKYRDGRSEPQAIDIDLALDTLNELVRKEYLRYEEA